MAFVTALAGFDRLSPYGAATSLLAYLLGPSLTGRNGHHDRVAFCGFTTYLLLGSLLLFKHGCFSLFEAARASRALDPPTSSSLAEECASARSSSARRARDYRRSQLAGK
jgi:CO dehydrogenase/acetyl-CoA synthase epsilon subunit